MEHTHLDPTRAAPPRQPEVSPPGADHRTGSAPSLPASPNGSPPSTTSGPPDLRALGEYRILRRLGEGGMGAVYLGYDGRLDRQVALKVLSDALAGNQGYIDRFYREARSGQLLNHPNIVRTLGAGQDRITRKYYLVLEYVDGPSAQFLLQQFGRLSVGDAVHIALDIARGLEHAHSRNIVHRDIKPDNILITRSGVAKLGDMGLAKRTDEPSHLTAARQGFGTTAYMPYEQAINAKYADGRSDIYALGATLYHLLTGQVPFPGENHLEVVEKKNQGYYRPASALGLGIPPGLDLILAKMLARQPRDRYQTASELIIDLERSRLAVPVPSFADPELARNDPLLQSWLNTGEPTRLDPDAPGAGRPPKGAREWIVRYRNRAGRAFTTRLSTEHLIERLEEGTLPADAEARRADDDEETFGPLSDYPELREHIPEPEPDDEPAPPPAKQSDWLMLKLVAGAAVLAGVLLLLGRWLLSR
jgi:serine/threonine-protein kinase